MMRAVRYVILIAVLGVVSFVGGIVLMDIGMGMVVGKGEVSTVPDLDGLSEGEAARALEDASLYLSVDRIEFDAEADSGTVIGQRPGAEEKVKRGRRIAVVLSSGPERSVVPALAGERVRQARIALGEVGLQADDVLYVPHEQVGRDIVIGSSPVAGTPAVAGEPIRLLVSLGPEPSRYLMPDLRGKSLSDVRRHLRHFELSLARVAYRAEEGARAGAVLEQIPPAGARVDRETSIELVVASQ